jgi:hypothetical protein
MHPEPPAPNHRRRERWIAAGLTVVALLAAACSDTSGSGTVDTAHRAVRQTVDGQDGAVTARVQRTRGRALSGATLRRCDGAAVHVRTVRDPAGSIADITAVPCGDCGCSRADAAPRPTRPSGSAAAPRTA